MAKVMIPQPYRGVTQGATEVPVEAETVRACLQAVEAACPGFAELVFEANGAPHRWTKLFLNGEPVPPDALDAPVSEADVIEVMSPIAGG